MKFCRQAASWKNKRKHRKTKENLFFLVFVLFTSRWSVRKVLDGFLNRHLSAIFVSMKSTEDNSEKFLNFAKIIIKSRWYN